MEECIKISKNNKQRELNQINELREETKKMINEEKVKERETARKRDKGKVIDQCLEDKKYIEVKHTLDQLQEEILIIKQAIWDGEDEIEEKNKYIQMHREEKTKRMSSKKNLEYVLRLIIRICQGEAKVDSNIVASKYKTIDTVETVEG